MGFLDKVGDFLGGAVGKVVDTVKDGPAGIINMVLSGIGTLVKEGIKALGPLIAGMIESLVSVLFEYIVYAIKKLIVPVCKYGCFAIACVGFIVFVFFGIVCACYIDRKAEEALLGAKTETQERKDENGNIIKEEVTNYHPSPAYSQYKELKFKYIVACAAGGVVFVISGVLCALGWFVFKPPPSPPDISNCFKPFENAIK